MINRSALFVQGAFGTLKWARGLLFFIRQLIHRTILSKWPQMTSNTRNWPLGVFGTCAIELESFCSVWKLISRSRKVWCVITRDSWSGLGKRKTEFYLNGLLHWSLKNAIWPQNDLEIGLRVCLALKIKLRASFFGLAAYPLYLFDLIKKRDLNMTSRVPKGTASWKFNPSFLLQDLPKTFVISFPNLLHVLV